MAKEREDRYQTPDELLEDLKLLSQGQPLASEPLDADKSTIAPVGQIAAEKPRRRTKRVRREPRKAGSPRLTKVLIGLGVLIVILLSAILWTLVTRK